jgi:hypothetical protein
MLGSAGWFARSCSKPIQIKRNYRVPQGSTLNQRNRRVGFWVVGVKPDYHSYPRPKCVVSLRDCQADLHENEGDTTTLGAVRSDYGVCIICVRPSGAATDAGANRFVQPVEMAELTSFTAYHGLEKQVPSLPELRTESNRRSE